MKKIITWINKTIKNIRIWIKMVKKKILNLIKIIGKWIWIFIKKVWLGTFGIAIWFSACFIIYKQTEFLLSDKIQAWAIVTLVFVTLFYAYQTFKNVNEEKKRRIAEFGEKRMKELLYPLGRLLIALNVVFSSRPLDRARACDFHEDFIKLHFQKGYMATKSLNDKILKYRKELSCELDEVLHIESMEEEIKWRKSIREKIDEMIKQLNRENRSIMIHIKKTYGYYTGETIEQFEKGELNEY